MAMPNKLKHEAPGGPGDGYTCPANLLLKLEESIAKKKAGLPELVN